MSRELPSSRTSERVNSLQTPSRGRNASPVSSCYSRTIQPRSPLSYHLAHRFGESRRQGLIHNLKHRRQNTVDSEAVLNVLQSYILPLLEQRAPSRIGRRLTEETQDSSVYKDLKVSQDLAKRNTALGNKLEALEIQIKTSAQEVHEWKERCLRQEAECSQYKETLKYLQLGASPPPSSSMKSAEELAFYSAAYTQLSEENNKLRKELCEAKNASEEFKGLSVQLQQENSVLQLTNRILSEKLRGIYAANQSIGLDGTHKLLEEFEVFKCAATAVAAAHSDLEEISQRQRQKQEFNMKYASTVKEVLSKKILNLQKELRKVCQSFVQAEDNRKSAQEEADSLAVAVSSLSHKLNNIVDEHEALKQRIGVTEAKTQVYLCRNCYKSYSESTNYDWSCRRHLSEFSGLFYFCCGATDKKAEGCLKSKHEPKTDLLVTEQSVKGAEYCSSCREIGHSHTDCPKDPNIRTHYLADEENYRISFHAKTKKKNKNRTFKFLEETINRNDSESDS